MSTWRKISRWEAILVVAGLAILAISMIYSSYLARELSEGERNQASMYVRAQEEISKHAEDYEADLTFYQDIILQIDDIPVLVTDFNDLILYGRSFGAGNDTNMSYLQVQLESIQESGPPPIINTFDGYKIYYKQSRLLTRLTYFPLVQLLLIGTFIAIGFFGLNSTRRAEQNRVWVGMAKETAHQLGTPISAILAWLEHLKETATDAQGDIIQELEKDVERLELIADRFSKIGSAPALVPTDIYAQLIYIRDYMARRASRKIEFDFPDTSQAPLLVQLNQHLFNWVLENLIRNSLDAMDDTGTISAKVYEESGYACIDVSDTGKGIPSSKFKAVFNPGYTTKKRGWGLGLSLAKRIIENYHSGKIYVKRSAPDMGTTFTIKLVKA